MGWPLRSQNETDAEANLLLRGQREGERESKGLVSGKTDVLKNARIYQSYLLRLSVPGDRIQIACAFAFSIVAQISDWTR